MNGLACLMFIFSICIFAAGTYLHTGRKGDLTELLIWKNPHANKMTKSEIKNVGKWTMISSIVPFVITVIVLIISNYDSTTDKFDVNLNKGAYTTVCETTEDKDNIKVITKTTTNYNKDNYAINTKIKAIYKFVDEKTFDFYSEEAQHTAETYEKKKDITYKYKTDKNLKTITTLLAHEKLSYTEEMKELYKAKTMIESVENENGKCTIIGITREDIYK